MEKSIKYLVLLISVLLSTYTIAGENINSDRQVKLASVSDTGQMIGSDVKSSLTNENMDRLLGQWYGEIPVGCISQTFEFRFEMTKEGKLTAYLDCAYLGVYNEQITDVSFINGVLRFIVPDAHAEYAGKIIDNNIYGGLKLDSTGIPLRLGKL